MENVNRLILLTLCLFVQIQAQAREAKDLSVRVPPFKEECARMTCDVKPAGKVTVKRQPVSVQVFQPRKTCCSGGSGVCGCTAGRAVCCDGAVSASCGCE